MVFEKNILVSERDPLKKICYTNGNNGYSCVSFLDKRDNAVTICASSQIGCNEACLFCMTGSKKFIANLTKQQIYDEFVDALSCISDISQDKEKLYIIMEGMGEAYYNLENVFDALLDFLEVVHKEYKTIVFSISTVGNIELVDRYMDFVKLNGCKFDNVKYKFQLSLHTPFDEERVKLMPVIARKMKIGIILDNFYRLADFLDIKLKCNYLVLNYPWGGNNYSEEHLQKLASILDPKKAKIKLTKYSETGKGFSSPSQEAYDKIKAFLQNNGFEIGIRDILGEDLGAACGMLDYQN